MGKHAQREQASRGTQFRRSATVRDRKRGTLDRKIRRVGEVNRKTAKVRSIKEWE